MMRSLEKVLTQSTQFVDDIKQRKHNSITTPTRSPPVNNGSKDSYFTSGELMQPLLSSFIALHRSLQSKVKYYQPACDRVLKILGKGIADRKTSNGEVLRRFGEMKNRWKALVDRIGTIEVEMQGVEEMLRSSGGATVTPSKASNSTSSESQGGSKFQSFVNPSPATPSSINNGQQSALSRTRPNHSPTVSISPPDSARRPQGATPTRPPKSFLRSPPPDQAPPTRPQILSHQRSGSMMTTDQSNRSTRPPSSFGNRSFTTPAGLRRAPSPAFSNDGSVAGSMSGSQKPRWNISTKRTDNERSMSPYGSAGNNRLSTSFTPKRSATGRQSALGTRSSSRMSTSLARSVGGSVRPASPAFSDASSSFVRDRPMTPSRIPMPTSITRRPSQTLFPNGIPTTPDDDEMEDLRLSSTSIMQRVMTPTNRSRPPLSSSSSSRTKGFDTSSSLFPYSSSSARGGPTPEPNVKARANRMSYVRAPSSSRTDSSLQTQTTSKSGSKQDNNVPGSYTPNPIDPLEVGLAKIINQLPLLLNVERVDPMFSRTKLDQMETIQARYQFTLGEHFDRVNPKPLVSQVVSLPNFLLTHFFFISCANLLIELDREQRRARRECW